jgi:predicted DNA-binding transcriptional regulator AlpA
MKNRRVQGAADYCGLSKSYLDKLRLTGGGPVFFRLGRAIVYNDRDLDDWMESRKVASNDNRVASRGAA